MEELKSSVDGYTEKDYIALYNAFKDYYSARHLELRSDFFFGNSFVSPLDKKRPRSVMRSSDYVTNKLNKTSMSEYNNSTISNYKKLNTTLISKECNKVSEQPIIKSKLFK